MHEIQKRLLHLIAQGQNLGQLTLREIGKRIGEKDKPQKIKHHLNQLEKKGLIKINKSKELIEKATGGASEGLLMKGNLLAIPILGAANAGPALRFADENIEGYLRISSTLLGRKSAKNIFALMVDGPSMNRAEVGGKKIEDGDFVIIDSPYKSPKDGDIVLSIIDNMANIKRFHHDRENNQIGLISESSQNFPPIYLHETDNYIVNGRVFFVVKKLKKR